jgi:hypothetical protein
MSGPLSVPAAIAAALVPNAVATLLLAATAMFCFIFSSYWVWRIEREKREEAENQLAAANDFALTQWGNVRVADNPAALALFREYDPARNKFIALLTQNQIGCWARRLVGPPDLVFVPGTVWNEMGVLDFQSKNDTPGSINQTYIRKPKQTLFYDVHLNFAQMKRIWPTIVLREATEDVREIGKATIAPVPAATRLV